MRIIELILIIITILSIAIRSLWNSESVILISGTALALLYLIFSFLILNRIRLKEIAKRSSYHSLSIWRILGSNVAGIALSMTAFAILFRFLLLDGAYEMAILSIVALLIIILVSTFKYFRTSRKAFYKDVLVRTTLAILVCVIVILIREKHLIEYYGTNVFSNDKEKLEFAKELYGNKKYEKSINVYEELINSNPDIAEYYNNYGASLHRLEKLDEAVIKYSKAISLDPEYDVAYFNRGFALYELEEYEKAIDDFKKSNELGFENPRLFNYYGICLARLDKDSLAVIEYTKAIKLDSLGARYYRNRSTSLDKIGKFNEALADLEYAIHLEPDNQLGYNYRGRIYRLNSYYHEAIQDFDNAISLDTNNYENYYYRANAKLDLKLFKSALEDYNKAIALNKNDQYLDGIYYYKAMAHWELEEFSQAYKCLERTLLHNPDHEDAQKKIKVLQKAYSKNLPTV